MNIRTAVPADLQQCIALDHHYTTKRVWQMSRREPFGSGEVMVDFHSVRLPRPMRVQYPRSPERLWDDWRRWNLFLVAEEDGYVRGYLGLMLQLADRKAWVRDLVVGRGFRRSGIGTDLLRQAMQWAESQNVRQVTLEMQSKNYPAIRFSQKLGFSFCGFDEAYYPNQDIALFFVARLIQK